MILGFGSYEYRGIPLDGYSYEELKTKYYGYKANHAEQQTAYQQPPQDHQTNVNYQQPNDPAQQGSIYQRPVAPVQPNETQNDQNDSADQNQQ